jgi:hypothetical protein
LVLPDLRWVPIRLVGVRSYSSGLDPGLDGSGSWKLRTNGDYRVEIQGRRIKCGSCALYIHINHSISFGRQTLCTSNGFVMGRTRPDQGSYHNDPRNGRASAHAQLRIRGPKPPAQSNNGIGSGWDNEPSDKNPRRPRDHAAARPLAAHAMSALSPQNRGAQGFLPSIPHSECRRRKEHPAHPSCSPAQPQLEGHRRSTAMDPAAQEGPPKVQAVSCKNRRKPF